MSKVYQQFKVIILKSEKTKILKKKIIFSICKKNLVNFYRMYNWKLEKKKNIKSRILIKNKFVMSFNLNKELKNGIELEI